MNIDIARNSQEFHIEVTFQQDGGPSHYFRDLRNYLEATSRNKGEAKDSISSLYMYTFLDS